MFAVKLGRFGNIEQILDHYTTGNLKIPKCEQLQKALRSTQGQGGHRSLVPQPGLQRGQQVPQGDQRPLHGATCSR